MAEAAYDVIVVGLGAMGSATAYHLAKRGRRVLGLEAFAPLHRNGSSHGRTRGIREAYGESPAYVPLVQRAYALWRELEAESGQPLLTITGGVSVAAGDGVGHHANGGQYESAARYGLRIETLTADELMARYPGVRVPQGYHAVYDPHTGFLRPEACVATHLDLAARHGATLRYEEPVRGWAADGDGVRVETDRGTYRADRLAVLAGPWAGRLLADLGLPLEVRRMYNVYFEPTRPELYGADRFPVWGLGVPEGSYYGVPYLPGDGFKIGRHDAGEPCTPETARREVSAADIAALREVVETYLPGAVGPVRETATCLYTMTPDGDFIIDRHPTHPQVAYASPCSGHGFKFSAAIGEIMADMATDGAARLPIGFLSASRFAPAAV